jgi:hypothetical protein
LNYNYFEFGEVIDFLSMPEDEAIAILGEPVYRLLKESKPYDCKGHLRVASIDRQSSTITLEWKDK